MRAASPLRSCSFLLFRLHRNSRDNALAASFTFVSSGSLELGGKFLAFREGSSLRSPGKQVNRTVVGLRAEAGICGALQAGPDMARVKGGTGWASTDLPQASAHLSLALKIWAGRDFQKGLLGLCWACCYQFSSSPRGLWFSSQVVYVIVSASSQGRVKDDFFFFF